ncbi:calcium/sodium antiporter [soil metagenome]
MIADFSVLALGLAVLVGGASALVRGGSSLALRLGLSRLVVGLTVVAFGTSAPELVVSVDAALRGAGGIAIGNVVGSNIANVALILGVGALIRPVLSNRQLLIRDVPFLIAVTIMVCVMLLDNRIGLGEGMILCAVMVGYLGYTVAKAKSTGSPGAEAPELPVDSLALAAALTIGGLLALVLGSNLFVSSAVALAAAWGMPDALIGLTIVAVGTSLPELATTIAAALKGESDIAIGNVIGSNLFNLFAILGIAAMVRPLHAPGLSQLDLMVMFGLTLALVPLLYTNSRVSRPEGALLLSAYAGFIVFRILSL